MIFLATATNRGQMSRVHFHAGDTDLELSGSESFVVRQLRTLSSFLGPVDQTALVEPEHARAPEPAPPAPEAEAPAEAAAHPTNGGERPAGSDLIDFFRAFQVGGPDPQSDAALLFAYYLQRREGLGSLQLNDLIRCCIRAGVDTRNFNRTVGALTRRGFLETVRHGHAWRLSEQGVAAVESRM